MEERILNQVQIKCAKSSSIRLHKKHDVVIF